MLPVMAQLGDPDSASWSKSRSALTLLLTFRLLDGMPGVLLAASGNGEPVWLMTLGECTLGAGLVWDVILCSLHT